MINTEYPLYDFLTASRIERPLSDALKVWTTKFAELFAERWQEFAPTEISVVPQAVEAISFDAAQTRWSQPCVGVPIKINGDAVHGMIVAERSDILILLMEILSETISQKPADRALTSIEVSLCEMLFDQSLLTFGEAWPDKEILPTEIGPVDPQPNRCRLFTPTREVLMTGFQIQTTSCDEAGPALIQWVFARDEMKKLLGVVDAPPINNRSGETIPIENVSQISLDVCVQLGQAELGMNELVNLDPGDIIKFDQRIEAPLVLNVNEKPVFAAWPGRVGQQQCLQVDSII